MSMLSGMRSAVASQATAHVEAATVVRSKLEMRLPEILEVMRVQILNAYIDTYDSLLGRIYDTAFQLYPLEHEERCLSGTCRRILSMYSLLYEPDQLSSATHDRLRELFGVATATAFKHLAQMVRARHLVDFQGPSVYMPHVERLAIPVRIVHGVENACFHPTGSEESSAWLRAHKDPTLFSLVRIPKFGHIDCIFGERAASLVYPHILKHLERSL